ncbi:MAG: 6-bladed beta-propeller, partial [Tannerella sp.]|nr:6-bladed beta-propeller [Tannerella sp.]
MGLKIKTNSRIFFLIIISNFVWGCTNPNENLSTGKTIYFDIDKSIENFDIGAITDSTFQIIPLETTDNSLIASIGKIEIRNDRIFIMDNLARSVYIYEMDGKYWGKINATGQGPGEYAHLSYMTVTDSSVLVIDHFSEKQIEYRTSSLQYIR